MSGILGKHISNNFFDRNFIQFRNQLEVRGISITAIPGPLLIRTYCESCDEECVAIKYHGERILLSTTAYSYVIHQCPHPVDESWPDDPEIRDGDGEIRQGGWNE